jgi:hypothetical protein
VLGVGRAPEGHRPGVVAAATAHHFRPFLVSLLLHAASDLYARCVGEDDFAIDASSSLPSGYFARFLMLVGTHTLESGHFQVRRIPERVRGYSSGWGWSLPEETSLRTKGWSSPLVSGTGTHASCHDTIQRRVGRVAILGRRRSEPARCVNGLVQ